MHVITVCNWSVNKQCTRLLGTKALGIYVFLWFIYSHGRIVHRKHREELSRARRTRQDAGG